MYIHERSDWPKLHWNQKVISGLLLDVRLIQSRLLGRLQGLGVKLCEEAVLRVMTQDVLKTSEIEGEKLDAEQVRSSFARRLGIKDSVLVKTDRHVDGVVEMMLDAVHHFELPMTVLRLFKWHALLFPDGSSI